MEENRLSLSELRALESMDRYLRRGDRRLNRRMRAPRERRNHSTRRAARRCSALVVGVLATISARLLVQTLRTSKRGVRWIFGVTWLLTTTMALWLSPRRPEPRQ